MAVHIRFSFFGEEQVDRSLMAFAERSSDLTPAWELIRQRFVAYEQKWFSSEGDGNWPALSPDYARWKAKHFPGQKILVRTGQLKASLEGPDIAIMEPSYAVFGTGDPVAAYHQTGGGNLPRRRVIDLDDDERTEWVRVLQRYLVEETP